MPLAKRNFLNTWITAAGFLIGSGCSTDDDNKGSSSPPVKEEQQENLGTIVDDGTIGQGDATAYDGSELATLDGTPPSVRNYDEVYRTMSVLTGVPTDDPVVRTYYRNSVQNSLPTTGQFAAFLGSQQLAVTKLATEFCDRAYQSTAEENRQRLFGEFGLYTQPVLVFSEQGKLSVVQNLLISLWGLEAESLGEDNDYVAGLTAMMDDLTTIMLQNNPGTTDAQLVRGGIVGTCTSILSSAQVIMY